MLCRERLGARLEGRRGNQDTRACVLKVDRAVQLTHDACLDLQSGLVPLCLNNGGCASEIVSPDRVNIDAPIAGCRRQLNFEPRPPVHLGDELFEAAWRQVIDGMP